MKLSASAPPTRLGDVREGLSHGVDNRTATGAGGTEAGTGLRTASYTRNRLHPVSAGFPAVSRATAGRLADRPAVERPEISHEVNQYTARTVPAAVDVLGVAASGSAVTVNSQAAYRRGEYFWRELGVANGSAPVATSVTVGAGGPPTTGKLVTPPASQAFVHDLDGNLTDDGVWTYTWDLAHEIKPRRPSSGRRGEEARQRSSSPRVVISRAGENRLVGMQHKTTLADTAARRKLAFEYDARGRRIRRQVFPWSGGGYSATATSDQRFVYDGWNLVAVFNASLTLQTAYIWGLDLSGTPQGAGGVGGLLASLTGTTAQFAAYDGNGNVRALADGGTGAWSAQYEYGPFGELVRATGAQAKANPFRFSTKWHDDESDLLYYGHRYYQPATGRWPNRDPIDELGGLNLYGMVGNNPSGYVDYLGLWQLGPFWFGKPPTWIDPNGNYHYDTPPSQRPPTDDSFLGEIDSEIAALSGRLGGVQKVCRTIKTTSDTALSFTPQNTFSEVFLGESLSGEKLGPGSRLIAAGTTLPGGFVVKKVVGKTVTACCGKVTICLFIQRHHLIPQGKRYANNPLIKAAGANLEDDVVNHMDLINHSGRHTGEYHQSVEQLLNQAYQDYRNGKMSAQEAYEGVCRKLREGITDGSIIPYISKDVHPAP